MKETGKYRMEKEVIAAVISAAGTVLASVIGVAGVYSVIKYRRKVELLSQQVEAYYQHEGALVSEIYRLENSGAGICNAQLPSHRRKLRDRLATTTQRPSMTAAKARQLREQIL